MNKDHRHLSRRTFIGASGAALTTALAGCLGDSGSETSTFATAFEGGRPPTEVHFNPWNPSNYAQTYSIYWIQHTTSAHGDGSVSSSFFEKLSVDGAEVTIKFPTDWGYWNGDDITAEDYLVEAEIDRYQDPEGSPIKSHELIDDYTVRRTYKNEVSPTVAKLNAGYGMAAPKSVFRKYLERYRDATTKSERQAVTDDLLKMTISTETFVEEGLGSSLFKIEDFNSSETLAVKQDDHPWSDRTNIEELRVLPNVESGTQVEQLEKSNELDMTQYITENQRSEYPDNLENVYKLSHYNCQKYILNWNNEHLGNRSVRRAIIAAIDIPSIVNAATQTGMLASPTQVQTGIRETIEDMYLGKGFTDQLIQYPVKADKERARTHMEDANYSMTDGTWVSPDGTAISFDIITQSAVSQSQPTKVFSDQLNEFGMETNMNAIGQDYYSKLQEWEFDIAWIWHVALPFWHPTAYFSNNFYGILAGDPDSGTDTGPTGVPFSTEIPKEVGAETVGSNGVQINPAQLMNDLNAASSAEETKTITRKLVRWVNFDLPSIIHMQENRGFGGDVSNFSFPNPDETRLDRPNPGPWALTSGLISAK
ncbi:ABC transporter substrate-binding protein [Halocatena pleomorpha]|uniref:ABC transporter substrate-binding protein n=1 Tax=Halocatena pleomorpha TaxID=1785090 RepID=A0A3P3R7U7_9EURY|nr:ABC transporter substrate-binding protein [Halocatena pleomorpha]RRJ29444.1 ABC transporter substrate-binding protein [Halocatena pleomorpha]